MPASAAFTCSSMSSLKEGGRVVLNPNDVFVMDLEADQSKLMNGRKMKEIIRDTYAFAHASTSRSVCSI